MSTSKTTTNRRKFFKKGAVTAAAAATATAAAALPAAAQEAPVRKVYPDRPGRTPLFSSAVTYGNLVFIAGVGAHVEPNEIKAHTKIVLDNIKQQLESVGSSMEKVLKAQVFLADLNDYAGLNEVYQGAFGSKPPVRTTVSVAGVPGNSKVEIDVIAFI